MTISTTNSIVQYNGNGVTTEFSVPYQLTDEDDLSILVTNPTDGTVQGVPPNTTAELAKGEDYTVTLEDDGESGATVNFDFAPSSSLVVTIRRVLPLTQQVDYTPNNPFPAETHEETLDRLTLIAQQLQEQVDRAFKLDIGGQDALVSQTLAPRSTLSNAVLVLDGDGNLTTTPYQQSGVLSWNGETGAVNVTTDALPEGSSNQYFTDQRAQDAVGSIIQGAGGITVSYNSSVPSITVNFTTNTDSVPEGSSNLYFTEERAQDAAWSIANGGSGIEVAYDDAGNAITVSATLGNGLGFDGDADISVGLAGGLFYSGTDAIAVNPGSGITLDGNAVAASLGNGMTFNGDAIEPSLGSGLQFSGGSFAVDLGEGLQFNGNEVRVNAGDGLGFSGDVLKASLGTGLRFSVGDIEITSPAARTDRKNVFESGNNGGQQTIKGSFPNIFLYEDDNTNGNARVEVRDSGVYTLRSVDDDGSSNANTRWSTNLGNGVHSARGGRITNVGAPTNSDDAVTKNYVDTTTAPDIGDIFFQASAGFANVSDYLNTNDDPALLSNFTENSDPNNDFDPSTGEYTVSQSGTYLMQFNMTGNAVNTKYGGPTVFVNGNNVAGFEVCDVGGDGKWENAEAVWVGKLQPGDVVTFGMSVHTMDGDEAIIAGVQGRLIGR